MSPISAIFKRGTTPRETAAAATDHADRASDDLSSSNEGKPSGSLDGKSWVSKVPEEELLGAKESLLHQSRKTYGKMRSSWSHRAKTYGVLDWAGMVLPCIVWLRTYRWRSWLYNDVMAGLSVAATVVPQGISYAQLAGVPSVFGLYGAFVPVWLYAATGSSKHLAVGPVAVTSMILYSGINENIFRNPNDNYNTPTDPAAQQQYNIIAIQVAFLAGILYTAFGVLRLGWITQFVSHAVIAGFTTGAATVIGLSQVRLLFGYNRWYQPDIAPVCVGTSCVCPNQMKYDKVRQQCYIPWARTDVIYKSIYNLIDWHSQFKWQEFVMGVSWLIILFGFKFLSQRFRRLRFLRALGPLTVVVMSIAISNIWDLKGPPAYIRVVGPIPSGMPPWTGGWIFSGFYDFKAIMWLSLLICLIDVMESTSIATQLANKNNYQLNYTQELCALGAANVLGSFTSCYTTTGSFSRSAIQDQVVRVWPQPCGNANSSTTAPQGSKSGLAQFISGLTVMIVLLLLTGVFTNMPQNAMGAIVISAVVGLWDFKSPVRYWRTSKLDLLVYLVALIVVLFVSIEIGLVVAIGLSLLLVLFRVGFPKATELGKLPGTDVYRSIKQYTEAVRIPGLAVIRIDAPLYFANLRPLRASILKQERAAELFALQQGTKLHYVVLDFGPVTDMDGDAVDWVIELIDNHTKRGVQLLLANPVKAVVTRMLRGRVPAALGEHHIFVRTGDAVEFATDALSKAAAEPAPKDVPSAV